MTKGPHRQVLDQYLDTAAEGRLTGAGFNPARSFGPAIVSGEWSGGADDFLLVYVLAPIIGALIAGLGYFNLVIAPGAKGVGGAEPVG